MSSDTRSVPDPKINVARLYRPPYTSSHLYIQKRYRVLHHTYTFRSGTGFYLSRHPGFGGNSRYWGDGGGLGDVHQRSPGAEPLVSGILGGETEMVFVAQVANLYISWILIIIFVHRYPARDTPPSKYFSQL